ncbi:MAG: zinc-ribbon domain-containing protein [Caloramator sp.]|nr:zinc-ribbon domain-containing protein [Caloramator sp.]
MCNDKFLYPGAIIKSASKKEVYEAWTNERMDRIIQERALKIKRLSDVKGWREKVKFRCLDCGNEWETTPSHIRAGHGCPECAKARRRSVRKRAKYTTKEVREILEHFNFILLDEHYYNALQKLHIKCNKCLQEFERSLNSIQQGHVLCPYCKGNIK